MDWILSNLPLLIFLFVVIRMIRGVLRAKAEKKEQGQATPATEETEDQRRVREIQERIRRMAAERRERREEAELPPPLPPIVTAEPPAPQAERRAPAPPVLLPTDPFGGGKAGKLLRKLERRKAAEPPTLAPAPAPASFPTPRERVAAYDLAEVQRQEDLAERMRALEEERALAQRRAAQLAAFRSAESDTTTRRRAETRDDLLVNIREPKALRRAILLREVLGTPVGLR